MPAVTCAVNGAGKASKRAARKSFDRKSKEAEYEQAYKREYMFWYNRVKKLEKNHVSWEQLEKAQSALKQFRKEAGQRKKQIQNGGVIYGTIYELDDWARGYYSGNLRRVRGTDYPHG